MLLPIILALAPSIGQAIVSDEAQGTNPEWQSVVRNAAAHLSSKGFNLQAAETAQNFQRQNTFDRAGRALPKLVRYGERFVSTLESWGIDAALSVPRDANGDALVKSEDRAAEKVKNDYGGDWADSGSFGIKDLSRMTLIVPHDRVAWTIRKVVQDFSTDKMTGSSSGREPIEKTIHAATDPCGYSGSTVFVWLDGSICEIQINTAGIIFAKSGEDARPVLGDDYDAIARDSDVPGGLGHLFYEHWRSDSTDATRKEHIGRVSKQYYEYFRKGKDYWGTAEAESDKQLLLMQIRDLGLTH